MSRTAQVLGLERSNLYRKMRSYGIEVERDGAEPPEAEGNGANAAYAGDDE